MQDTLIVQSDSDMERMVCVHESSSEDPKIDIGRCDSTSDRVVGESIITYHDT